jgi:glycosyl transferase family 87
MTPSMADAGGKRCPGPRAETLLCGTVLCGTVRRAAAVPPGARGPAPGRTVDIVAGVNQADGNVAGGAAATAGRAPGARIARAGAIAFAAVLVSWLVYAAVSGPFGALNEVDLTVYRDGGLIVRHVAPYYDPHAGAPLYDWGGYSDLALKFTYTPFAAIAFAVASVLNWTTLSILSVVGNVAALVAALWFTFGGLGYADRRVRLGVTLLAAAVTFWLQPVVRTIYLGQVNLILMALILWDLLQPDVTASGKRRWWKGAATGVAAGVKLVPLIFVPYLLLTRRFREAAATMAGFAATVAAGFAVLPQDSSRWWLHGMFLANGNRTGFMGWAGNQSLRAIVTRFAGSVAAGQAPWIAVAGVALAAGLAAAVLLDRAGYPVPALLTTALTGLLVSPVSWDHHWVWIAPAVAVTGHYAFTAVSDRRMGERGARRAAALLCGLAVFLIATFGAWPDALWERARNLGSFSLGLLWAQPNTDPVKFATRGDQPSYVEYHWHGFQLLWGNAYILAGVALLFLLLGLGCWLALRRPAVTAAAHEPPAATVPRRPVPGARSLRLPPTAAAASRS